METVFDHNISPKEWESINGMDKYTYLSVVDEDSANWGLASLYLLRGKKKKAEAYANKLPASMKVDFWRGANHP